MHYLAHYNVQTGEILERRLKGDGAYTTPMPEPYVELTAQEGQYTMDGWTLDTSALPAVKLVPPPEPEPPTLDELKAQKRAEIWADGDGITAQLRSGFTITEQDSFADQRIGAADITAGRTETREAKLVAAIAARRGIETSELVGKITYNVAVADAVGAAVIGEQQRLDDLIKAAGSAEDLNAVKWTLTLESLLGA